MKALFILFLFLSSTIFAQKSPTDEAQPIVREGKLLYQSEMASWYGTDIFLERYTNRNYVGGYFSYSENDSSKCIFFSKTDNPKVIGTISFENTYALNNAKTDLKERDFTDIEKDLYSMRKLAFAEIKTDTLFKTYKNTDLNLIPLIDGEIRKVYVLTGPKQSGVVIFGNDYLLTFDSENKLTGKKRLHKNIIPIYFESEELKGMKVEGAMHSHLPETGDFITATDICTLMLYSKFAKWKTHSVYSKKYLNVWNCETNELTVIPNDRNEDNNQDQSTQKKKNRRNDQK